MLQTKLLAELVPLCVCCSAHLQNGSTSFTGRVS